MHFVAGIMNPVSHRLLLNCMGVTTASAKNLEGATLDQTTPKPTSHGTA
jgi:hypothetical protein